MSGVLALYEKELRAYFRSPIAYFVVAAFLLGTGYFFTYNVFRTEVATMAATLQNMGVLLVVVSPVITMRLFAAEQESGTIELLGTLPLRAWQLVAGKFLGAATLLGLMTAGTLVDLLPLYLFAEPETPAVAAGFLGFVLLGLACLALGQLFSALTRNQIVAALTTVSVLLALWFVGHLQAFQSTPALRGLVAYLSLSAHYAPFIEGLIRSESVVFYLLLALAALVLNSAYLEWRR